MTVGLLCLSLGGCWDWDRFRGDESDAAPDDAGSDDAAVIGACPCFDGSGFYCGVRALAAADERRCQLPFAATASSLLACSDGAWSVADDCVACARGVNAPSDRAPEDRCVRPECPCFASTAYCGGGAKKVADLDECEIPIIPGNYNDILYCPAGVWTVRESCRHGCRQESAGTPDACRVMSPHRLPFPCGTEARCTTGNQTGSHTGAASFAYDFEVPSGTEVVAMRAGTVLRVRMPVPFSGSCDSLEPHCGDAASTVEILHDDENVTLYVNVEGVVAVESERVTQGAVLGRSGSRPVHVQLQQNCGVWRCASLPIAFAETVIETGALVVSSNCE